MQTQLKSKSYNHSNDQHYLIQHDKVLKCICQLCTCGKHHCPRKPVKNDFQTSYSRQFRKFQNMIPLAQRPAYKYPQRHYSPEVLKSNYQENYQKHNDFYQDKNMSNSRLQQTGRAIIGPQIPFIGVSSYKQQYKPYQMAPQPDNQNPEYQLKSSVFIPYYKSKPNVKFQGISSYKSNFVAPSLNKVQLKQASYKKPDIPFYGVSSYTEQYKPIQIKQHQPVYQSRNYRQIPNVKFQGKSSYNDQYKPFQIQPIKWKQNEFDIKNQCNLNKLVLPSVNYINNKEHVFYDPDMKKFY